MRGDGQSNDCVPDRGDHEEHAKIGRVQQDDHRHGDGPVRSGDWVQAAASVAHSP